MFNKIKNKPLWYQVWAGTVALSAVYYLLKYFLSEPSPTDRFIEFYALFSLLLDYLIFPKEQKNA